MPNTCQNATPGETNSPTQEAMTPEQIDADLLATHERIAKREALRVARENLTRFEDEVLNPSGATSVVNQHHLDNYEPQERVKEIKIDNISIFTLSFDLQRRQDWLVDVRCAFRRDPQRYQTDEKKILAALNFLDRSCRYEWYRHVVGKPLEERQHIEGSWQYFEDWTLTLTRNATSLQADVTERKASGLD
ncbi:hypothetical protein BDV23DRAFT_184343 [Aspergillus alliaceus]|uniref:Uncharacterized protein n=1 Tax=Petromyces alliaceus TaxID=209559 RepID=A0A5N6GAY9_PETAA|nr:uncharacterized protein BDW43DRAFT_305846 [Aspergillus alliaceus]KAB8238957.1 hypothetical protein BDW43DRAFT_305846 [Aspergillus alliaceus]KAE8389590.1 hypothetical protein BDV23DRAFT_184343 [Aspergillus alliaceus]